MYRERIALPANAIFEATLEDVSRAGAQFELIARVRNEQPGNSPIPFIIAYDAGRINRSHSYVVRARILVGSQVWFTTDRNYPVLTAGHPDVVQLLLRRAPVFTNDARPPVTTSSPLENTHWRLTRVGSTEVSAGSQQREAFFILNSANRTVTGSGGCNRMTGSYELNGDRVAFNRVASTMMGCMRGMEVEQAFHNALNAARRWKISGTTLDLFDSAGTRLARLEAP
jgi:putative lipoprotein